MKVCNKCSIELISGVNIAPSSFKNSDYRCRPCCSKRAAKWQKNNPDKFKEHMKTYRQKDTVKEHKSKWSKEYYLDNQQKILDRSNKYYSNHKEERSEQYYENKDGHYSVYLLPNHNYVGQTGCIKTRMAEHRSKNSRYTENHRVLYTTQSYPEALELEELLHDMGYEGRNETYTQRKFK